MRATGLDKRAATVVLVTVCMAMALLIRPDTIRADTDPGRVVKTMEVKSSDTNQTRTFPGIVQANYETDLAFRVGGPLTSLDVVIGERVEQGDVLARIDPRDFELNVQRLQAALSQARANFKALQAGARPEDIARMEAQLAAARAGLEEAKSNFRRYEKLYEENAVARATFDTARTGYENAQAQVVTAEKALEMGRTGGRAEDIEAMEARIELLETDLASARNALDDTVLRAPIHGLVNKKYVDSFETVRPGEPIVSLLDVSFVEVKTSVPQNLIGRFNDWSHFVCTFDAHPGVRVPARVKELGQKTEGPGLSYPLVVRVDVPEDLMILPGMAASVSFSICPDPGRADTISVPATALFADPAGDPGVWKVDSQTMTVTRVPVALGEMGKDTVHVTRGLSQGDVIVTAGARFLSEGEKVRILDRTKEQ